MDIKTHYNKLYKETIAEISSDNYRVDDLIDAKHDNRYGLSLLIRPSDTVKVEIQKFLDKLKKVEPNQYYYPNTDIHITIISIISCYEGFKLNTIEPSKYVELIKKCIPVNEKAKIHFKGLTLANSCILLKGYVSNNSIDELRSNLRLAFTNSNLDQSLDERYLLQTAHSTVVRLREKLNKKDEFLKLIDTYIDYDFGTFEIDTIELTYNDWYHRTKFVQKLHEFSF